MSVQKSISSLRLDGGILCLDFVNTIDNRKKGIPHDYVKGFKELLEWYGHTRALSPKIIHTLERLAKDYPQKAGVVFEKSIALRELLHRLFTASLDKKKPAAADSMLFNTYVGEAYANIEISWQAGAGALQFNAPALEQVYWWPIKSAVELFTSSQLAEVKECPACGWLFLDKSRNGSRKWCSMSTCGDVNKVTRNYQRTKRKKL
ncbi:CGNR zinc finger domain-containing protein [Chitinophaga polysaccharea]|uniref:CGNR zinc finger domain-containing protein n=1 Tax=Chitinophaga polysaccharea TaxID=1293035 RepID=UPI00115A70D5|nr:CGNR zinc finger domain-containing protein [Chitinophaga polysaccharea]